MHLNLLDLVLLVLPFDENVVQLAPLSVVLHLNMLINIPNVLGSGVGSLLVEGKVVIRKLPFQVSHFICQLVVSLFQLDEHLRVLLSLFGLLLVFFDFLVKFLKFGSQQIQIIGFVLDLSSRPSCHLLDSWNSVLRDWPIYELHLRRHSNWLETRVTLLIIQILDWL